MLSIDEIAYLQQATGFFPRLSEEEKAGLLEHTAPLTYRRGQNIYSTENECVGVLLVKSGELRAYILSEDGREITLFRPSSGDVCILSASCVIQNITFDVSIDAEQDSQVLLISAAYFAKLMESNVYVENFSLKVAVDRFSDVMWVMEQILFMSFDRRLATFLLGEAFKKDTEDIRLTHDQIARYMGSAREVVSRMLKYFIQEGAVASRRGGIHITDKAKLESIAGM